MTEELTRVLDALASAVVVGPEDKLVLLFKDMTRSEFDEAQNSIGSALDAAGLQGRVIILAAGGDAVMGVMRS